MVLGGTGELGRSNEVEVMVDQGGDEVRPGALSSAPTCTYQYTRVDTYKNVDAHICVSVEGRVGGLIPAPNVTSRGSLGVEERLEEESGTFARG